MEREQLIRLVTAAQGGDGEALNELFNAFYNDVYYFVLKTVKDEDLACDITQESFVEIIHTIGDLKEPAAFVKWMKQITYHQCTRYFKKKKDVLVDEDEEGNTIFDIVAEDRTEFIPDEALDQQDFKKTILAMLDELSEEQRAAVLMYYYDELSVKQIAEIQGVSEGTVKSRLNYARKSIKNSVETYEKKNNIKLHSFAFLPFMFWLLKAAAEDNAAEAASAAPQVAAGVSAATGTAIAAGVATGTATAVAAGTTSAAVATTAAAATTTTATAAGTGIFAKIAALPLFVKIISVLVAAAIVIGSVAVAQLNDQEKPSEPQTSTQPSQATEPSNTEIPTQPSNATQPTDTTPVHVHTYVETVVVPTCTEQGHSVFTCECGDSYEANYVAALDHSWDAGTVTKEPTEEAAGERVYFCQRCEETRVELIPTLDHEHNYAQTTTEPTCTEQGYTTYTCACGDSYVGDYAPAIGHNYATEVIAPTFEAQGYTRYECRNCGHSYEDDFVDKLPTNGYVVPGGGTYITADAEYAAGQIVPIAATGDVLKTAEYTYTCFVDNAGQIGWRVKVNDETLSEYPTLLEEINDLPLISLSYAFSQCKALKETPWIPEGVTDLTGTFSGCGDLTTVVNIPNGVKIMVETFQNCPELENVPTIPEGVLDMSGAFAGCTGLTEMPTIPPNVVFMYQTFMNCSKLSTIQEILPESIVDLSYAFSGCKKLVTAPQIPQSVIHLDGTFQNCTALTTAPTIPENVQTMRECFYGCSKLSGTVTIHAKLATYSVCEERTCTVCVYYDDGSIPIICTECDYCSAFYDCFASTTKDIYLTGNGTHLYELSTTASNNNVTGDFEPKAETEIYYVVPEGCTYISGNNEYGPGTVLTALPAVGDRLITESYTYECFGINSRKPSGWSVSVRDRTREYYPDLLGEICGLPLLSLWNAFYKCENMLDAPGIPDTVTSLYEAFVGCKKLIHAPKIPESVVSMHGTFSGCTALLSVENIPDAVYDLSDAFNYCTSLTKVPAIPRNVRYMDSAFRGCTSLSGTIEINSMDRDFRYSKCFEGTEQHIFLTGGCCWLAELAETDTKGNVSVIDEP